MGWDEMARPWIAREAEIEAAHEPIARSLIDRAQLVAGERVLDIGFGTGSTVLAAAGRVGATGAVTGIDIAPPMVARAAERARGLGHVRLLAGDAQSHAFVPAATDVAISLFGTMFFADPGRAFANILRAMRPGGRFVFCAYGPRTEAPWFAVPGAAAASVLGPLPAPDPAAPGPMAFADAERVLTLLGGAGWQEAAAEDDRAVLTPPGSPAEVAAMLMSLGPTRALVRSRVAPERVESTMAEITAATALGFAPYQDAGGVRVPSLVRYFSARAPR